MMNRNPILTSLLDEEKRELLFLSRETIQLVTNSEILPKIDLDKVPENFRVHAATFVTLTKKGLLRGCIGGLEAIQPLVLDVVEHAAGAALHDFRFSPVRSEEVNDLEIEISILTTPQLLTYSGPADLLVKVRPNQDGVILRSGPYRATFLPQVWEKLPDPKDFFSHLCVKMGFPGDYWKKNDLEVSTYQVIEFSEG